MALATLPTELRGGAMNVRQGLANERGGSAMEALAALTDERFAVAP